MVDNIHNSLFMILLTLAAFVLSLYLYKKTKLRVLHPLLPSVLLIIAVLNICKIDYDTYNSGVFIIDFMLGPSVVALGLGLYEQRHYIKQNWLSMSIAILVGSIVGVVSIAGIALLMNPGTELTMTLFPKSVTSPIAIDISRELGGIPSLSAVIVIAVGIFGGLVGPFVLRALGITSRVAKGLAMGTSSHGIGTAVAVEMGAVEGAISGLAIGLMGLATAIVAPVVKWLIF